MIMLAFVLAFDVPEEPECVIDRCSEKECYVETPEGWVTIPKKENHHEGLLIECPVD